MAMVPTPHSELDGLFACSRQGLNLELLAWLCWLAVSPLLSLSLCVGTVSMSHYTHVLLRVLRTWAHSLMLTQQVRATSKLQDDAF